MSLSHQVKKRAGLTRFVCVAAFFLAGCTVGFSGDDGEPSNAEGEFSEPEDEDASEVPFEDDEQPQLAVQSRVNQQTSPAPLALTTDNRWSNFLGQQTITGKSDQIQATIIEHIDELGAGDVLQISIYLFTNTRFGDAIVAALNRGVSVNILSDVAAWNNRYGPAHRQMMVRLRNAGADVRQCFYACMAEGWGTNHEKLFIAERQSGRNWAIISSANLTGSKFWDQAFYFDGDHYSNLFLWLQWRFGVMSCRSQPIPASSATTDIAPFSGPANCPVVGNGGYESAYQGTVGTISPGPSSYNSYRAWIDQMQYAQGCRLEVVMGHLDDSARVVANIRAMRRLSKRGCKVDMIYSNTRRTSIESMARAAASGTEAPFEIEWQRDVHAKFMLWEGIYGTYGHRKLAWMGSANFTRAMYDNSDELMVRVTTRTNFDAMRNYFLNIEWDD